jgi:hypothetical protein
MYVVFGALCNVIVDSLELVEDILYRLHHDRLQRTRERVGIVQIVLLQHERRLCLQFSRLPARLALQHKIRDRELGRARRVFALRRIVVFLPYVVQ